MARLETSDKECHVHKRDHVHGITDPIMLTTARGIWAVKWSLLGLMVTAGFQLFVVIITGSVALLADTVHNFGDALTAVPLWIAFRLGRRKSTARFTYGYGRVEDLAGVIVVLTILASSVPTAYAWVMCLLHPRTLSNLWVIVVASFIGFVGNEAVAIFRIKVGKEIGSAALVADGKHARVDGLTSLGVLIGAVGVYAGLRLADPIMGLIITVAILRIVWESGQAVFTRLLDGIDPEVVHEMRHAVLDVEGVQEISGARVRWLGHRMYAELNITVCADMSVEAAHQIAVEVRHQLLHCLEYLSDATIHVDPEHAAGYEYHCVEEHEHDNLPSHSH
ncbi:MAG: cation transporter [Actinobacteria bacterium RBG_19FT_COMBO_54_7]|nr:MAG: cation transporter [Actinobacteria bacterium RBG_19FT_COMBO_54_7]